MSPLFLFAALLLLTVIDAAPTLCTNAPDATGIVHSLNPYVNVTFADSLTLEGQVASWPFVCNAAFRVTHNGTVRPFIFGDCYLANSDKSLILPLLTYGTYPEDYEASTGYTYRVAFTVHTLLGTDVKSGGVAQASFECVTQDIQGPAAMQLVVANRGPLDSTLSVLFSEPVFLCNGAPSFSSPANISLGLLSGTFSSQLNGIVWSMDVPYGTDSDTLGYPEFATSNLCDAAGNRLATYGGSWPLSPWSIGNEPLVTTNQKDMIVNSVKLYDTDDDGQADILVYPNSLPLVRPSPSIQVINVINQEQVLVGCTNDSWIPTTITCDAPTLFSFSQDYWMRSTENTSAPAAFSPYATLPVDLWAPTDLEPELQIRPVIVSFTSQIGSTEAAVSIAGFIQPTDFLENIYPWLFYDPSATYYLTGYSTFTDETQATVYLGAPLDTTRFGASPVYLSLSPELPFGLFTSQWKPVALSFPSSSQAIQPQYAVLTAGQRLDIWFHNYTGAQLSLDYFRTTNLNFTCPSFYSPLIYNATELRLNVSDCLGITTNLFLNASKGSIPLGDSFHLQQLVNFPVAYQRYYPIQPLGVYLYDYRVLAIWVDSAEFALQSESLNTSSLSISCGTLSGIELSTPQIIRANVSGCVEGEEARVIINSYPLAIANDSISALLNLNVSATLLAPATSIAATECFPTFNASLWKITHADVDESDWEPIGPATVDCSNQTAKVLLKDGDDMFCAMDIEHEGLNCTMTYRILAVQALVYETVTVFNLTSCSYRGPYVETAHVHGNGTLSVQMFTLSAITQESVQDYKFNLTCDGVNATLGNTSQVLVQGTIVQLEVLSGCSENSTVISLSIQQEALETVHFETNLDPDQALASQARDMNFVSSSCENYLHQLGAFGWSLAHISDPTQCLNTTAYTEEAVLVTLKSRQAQDGQTGSTAECQLVATLKGGYAHTVQLPLTLSDKTCTFKQPSTGIFDLEGGLLALFIIGLVLLLAGIFYLVLRLFMNWCKRVERKH